MRARRFPSVSGDVPAVSAAAMMRPTEMAARRPKFIPWPPEGV